MEEALAAFLLANAGLQTLVSNRINWNVRPQNNGTPAIVLLKVSGTRGYTATGPDRLIESRVQCDCWGKNFLQTKQVARAAVAAFNGIKGVRGGVRFQSAFVDSERDDFDQGSNVQSGTAERLYRTSLDIIIWYNGD